MTGIDEVADVVTFFRGAFSLIFAPALAVPYGSLYTQVDPCPLA
jgi:hypothetical protein